MKTRLCHTLGMEFPIFAFSHCRDVVAAVTNAGGFGVYGALGATPEHLEAELAWIEAQVDGRPYGVDIVLPAKSVEDDLATPEAVMGMVPDEHRRFVDDLLARYHVRMGDGPRRPPPSKEAEKQLVEVVLAHRAKLLVNALGPMPPDIVNRCHDHGVLTGALVGSPQHARKQVDNGVDVLIAQGTEAAGHTGEISTMVLVPRVVEEAGPVPVLAAGGIATGRQIAAALALGADGAWTGTIWLAVRESDTPPALQQKMLTAEANNTLRTRSVSGKPNRFLRSAWTDAWDEPSAPKPLPWPLQLAATGGAISRIMELQQPDLITTSVGQSVSFVREIRSARALMLDLVEDMIAAGERVASLLDDA